MIDQNAKARSSAAQETLDETGEAGALLAAAAAYGLTTQTYELASEVAVMFSVSHLNIVQVCV